MPTAEEWLAHFYPYLLDDADPRYVPQAALDMDLAVAADWRPSCLSSDRQNQAQSHYAAYLASYRRAVEAEANGNAVDQIPVAGPIVRKKEGDLELQFATSGGNATVPTSTLRANLTGPGTPYAAWEALYVLCGGASDVLEPGQLPVRRGAIATAFG